MLEDCITLVEYLDITHYVSAINLGACEYSVVTVRTEQKTLGVGTSVAAKPLVEGGMSGESDKRTFHKSQKQQKIEKIDNEKEKVTDRAVIGFEIQPLYKLVRIQFIQMMLRRAVMDYTTNIMFKGNRKFTLILLSSQHSKFCSYCNAIGKTNHVLS